MKCRQNNSSKVNEKKNSKKQIKEKKARKERRRRRRNREEIIGTSPLTIAISQTSHLVRSAVFYSLRVIKFLHCSYLLPPYSR